MLAMITVPAFPRFSDYLGSWLLEEQTAAWLWQCASKMTTIEGRAIAPHGAVQRITPPGGGKQIAIVPITGVLMKSASSFGGTSTVLARRDIRQAAADNDVGGILLQVDSPGGNVSGTTDLADEVRAANSKKPVWAAIEDLGASAAFWVASQASRVTLNSATGLVGSIGVMQVLHDVSAAAEREGIRTIVIKTGKFKAIGAPGAPIDDEQVAHLQQLVDSVMSEFAAAVQTGRKLSAAQFNAVAHGGVMTGNAALQARLIDAIQPTDKTLAELAKAINSGGRASGALPMRESTRTLPMTGI